MSPAFHLHEKIESLRTEMIAYAWITRRRIEALERKYNPNQPRVPRGNADGGEWTDSGGGGSSGGSPARNGGGNPTDASADGNPLSKPHNPAPSSSSYHPNTASRHAARNIYDPAEYPYGRGRCAAKVREAVEAGLGHPIRTEDLPPIRTVINPETGLSEKNRWARDYGPTFEKAGLQKILASKSGDDFPPSGYTSMPGDVAVIQPTSDPRHPEGHTAIYSKEGWVSDYKQRDFWPNARYRSEKPSYAVYRHSGSRDSSR